MFRRFVVQEISKKLDGYNAHVVDEDWIDLQKENDLMEVCINKDEKTVEWNIGKRIITIHNEHVLYAFKHGKNMLMIKEKYETSGSGFSAYDMEGNVIFSYKYLGNSIILKKMTAKIAGEIISADYEEEKRKLVILKETEKIRSLLIYDENCDFIAEIASPRGYVFVSLKNNAGNIMTVARGTNDLTRDSFGRNDWNFAIDFDNYYVERKSITQ